MRNLAELSKIGEEYCRREPPRAKVRRSSECPQGQQEGLWGLNEAHQAEWPAGLEAPGTAVHSIREQGNRGIRI